MYTLVVDHFFGSVDTVVSASPGKLTKPKDSQSESAINWLSILHLRYFFAKARQFGAFLFSVYFMHCK